MIRLGKKDIIWSYIGTVLSLCSNVIMLPFILHYLSADEYGLWSIFQSIGGITVLFDFGFAVTFARNIAYSWSGASELKKEGGAITTGGEPDFAFLKKVLKTCRIIYLLISLLALVLLLSVGSIYIAYVSRGVQGMRHFIAWGFYVAAVFMNLYYGYFGARLRGVGDVADANKATVIAKFTQIVLTIVLLWAGAGLVGTGIAYFAYGLLYRMLAKQFFQRFKEIGKKLKSVQVQTERAEIFDIFRIVWHNAWRDGVVTFANYLSNQASTIICSLYLPLSETGIYSLAVQLATAVVNISATMYNTYQPVMQSAYITNDKEEIRKCMSVVTVTYVGLYALGTLAVTVVGIPILWIIKPESALSIPVFLGVALYQFLLKFRNCYTSYFACTNRIIYMKAFVVSAACCVLLELFWMGVLKQGAWGLIAAQVISQLAYNVWHWPLKAHKEMQLGLGEMFSIGVREIYGKILDTLCRNRDKHD